MNIFPSICLINAICGSFSQPRPDKRGENMGGNKKEKCPPEFQIEEAGKVDVKFSFYFFKKVKILLIAWVEWV